MNKFKSKVTILFFMLSLIFSISSLANSGAISQGRLERSTTVNIADDTKSILKLNGFNNQYVYDLNKDYATVGSITNNAKFTINLIVMIQSDFSLITNKNLWQGMKIGEFVSEFTYGKSTARADLILEPGQTVDIQIAIIHNQSREVVTTFEFLANDKNGMFTMGLKNTINTPRQIIYQ